MRTRSARALTLALVAIMTMAGCLQSTGPSPSTLLATGMDSPLTTVGVEPVAEDALAALAMPTFWVNDTGRNGAEPNIGVTSDGTLFIQSSFATMRSMNGGQSFVRVDKTTSSNVVSLDPMLWVDPVTDRLFTMQLYGACSWLGMSDDKGSTWSTNPLGCRPGFVNDHQKISTGPLVSEPEVAPLVDYPNVVYYAYNTLTSGAHVSVSWDGGVTFPTDRGVMASDCSAGLIGHVMAAPDGTVYLPQADCSTVQIAYSTSNGRIWKRAEVPGNLGTGPYNDDPDIALDRGSNAYVVFVADDARVYLSRSTNGGKDWSFPRLISPPEVTSAVFPVITAGDEGRIAVSYIASTDDNSNWATPFAADAPNSATFHLYAGISLDALSGTATFATTKVTPDDDPVQRGSIWIGGGTRADRNLLDFFDMTVGPDGRVFITYADGCPSSCQSASQSRDTSTYAVVQHTGPRLYV